MVLGDENWQDCGTYWLHKYPQLTDPWKDERSFRLTTTNFSPIVNPTFYRGPDDVVKYYSGPPIKKSFQGQLASDCGLRNEPKGREWYKKKFKVKIKEVGLAVPKWDTRLGCSIDGDIEESNGIIEIKCPGKMYGPICKYLAARKDGWRPPEGYHDHIFDSHYDQMQGSMAIINKEWCDYIVYCLAEKKIFVERIYFDRRYWYNEMYPKIDDFLNRHEKLFTELRLKYESRQSSR